MNRSSATVKPLARIEPTAQVHRALTQKAQFNIAITGIASLALLFYVREAQPFLVLALAFLLLARAMNLFRAFKPTLSKWKADLILRARQLEGQYVRLHDASRHVTTPIFEGNGVYTEYLLTFLTGENRLLSFPCLVPEKGGVPATEYLQITFAEYSADGRLTLLHGIFR